MKRFAIAALGALLLAQPGSARNEAQDAGYFGSLASSGTAEMFFTKSFTATGPVEPLQRARITSIQIAQECEMAIYFENLPGSFAPYRSPMFISWFTLKGLNHYGSYHQFVRSNGGTMWGISTETDWNDSFRAAAQQLLDRCARD